jgi:type II secretory pathway pseudopilin PulG
MRRPFPRRRVAYTLTQVLIAITTMGILLAFAIPPFGEELRGRRLVQAVKVVESDLQVARTRAARTRRPVAIQLQQSPLELQIVDRVTGTVEKRRPLGRDAVWDLTAVTLYPASVEFLPNGYASTPFTLRLAIGTHSYTITATRTGLFRTTTP